MRTLFENLRCTVCGNAYLDEIGCQSCPDCHKPLEAVYGLRPHAVHPPEWQGRGVYMWRYREVLPLRSEEHLVSLGEGCTPVYRIESWEKQFRLKRIFVKDETANPTGSFKDRGLAVAVSKAREMGASDICLASAGNAGVSASAYAAAAGLKAHVFMPADTPKAFFTECDHYGAEVHPVEGAIDVAAMAMMRDPDSASWYNLSTFRQPYRLEGKKTMGYEVWEQLGGEFPDAIFFPTGGGTAIVALWKAFQELAELGLMEERKMPRLFAVQAEGCAPIARAFLDNQPQAERWEEPQTLALGIRVPASLGDYLVLKALRESQGRVVTVNDYEIRIGMREFSRTLGIFTGPEGGAAMAALRKMQGAPGRLTPNQKVLLFCSGGGSRYAELFS
jgi:threonine synthase